MEKNYYLLLLFVTIFLSCSEVDTIGPDNNIETEITDGSPIDNFAKILANALSDNILQDFLIEEAKLQKDGDYDILFAEVLDKTIPANSDLRSSNDFDLTFKDYLKSKIQTKSSVNKVDLDKLCNNILTTDPLLQIAIPNMENVTWDDIQVGKIPFYVAHIPDDYDDSICPDFLAYDQNGEKHMLDGKIAPKVPVVIISQSERLFNVHKSEKDKYLGTNKLYFETDDNVYFLQNFTSLSDELVNKEPLTRALSYERESNPWKMEYIHKAKFKNDDAIKKWEAWSAGRPEVVVTITFYENKVAQRELWIPEKGWAGGNLRTLDAQVITWDPAVIGKYISYHWRESDGGDKNKQVSITITGKTSFTFSWKVGNKDDIMGTHNVYYHDALSKCYDVTGFGDFQYWMTIK